MIQALTLILLCQLAGETGARALGLPVPGPVVGMGLMLALLAASDRVAEAVVPVGQGILRHLSLLFVPAGVGVVGHVDRLGAEAAWLMVAIVISTVLAIAAGALAFKAVARLTGGDGDTGSEGARDG
jgi:holin-like protein